MSDEVRKTGRKGNAAGAPQRRARGFLRAAELAPNALKQAGARRGFAELRLLTEWRAVVGEALSAHCRPLNVSYAGASPGLGATLVVAATGARAPEIEMQKALIIERVNAFYGYRAVSRLKIDQRRAPASGFAEAPAEFTPAPAPPAAPVDGVGDERLALALGRLGANIQRKSKRAGTGAKGRST